VITYISILLVVLFSQRLQMRIVIACVLLSVVVVPAAYWLEVKAHLVKNYQQERINVILDPQNADTSEDSAITPGNRCDERRRRFAGALLHQSIRKAV